MLDMNFYPQFMFVVSLSRELLLVSESLYILGILIFNIWMAIQDSLKVIYPFISHNALN